MNLSRIVERWAHHTPGRTAFHFQGADVSYPELWLRTERATRGLAGLGVGRGDRIAFLGYNHPDMLVLLFAASRLGAILVPLNWRLTVHEHRVILADCAPRVLFFEPEFAQHASELPVGLQFSLEAQLPEADPALEGTDDDEVLIVYTSGTTAAPKGAVLTQAALVWNAFNSIHAHDLRQDDHVLSPLPFFHVGGLNNQTLPALMAGATVTLHRRFEPGQWLADVALRKPTLSLLVPATMQAVIGHPAWAATDLSSLRMLNTGSMVVPESLIRAFHARGVPVGQIYGATETAPLAAVLMAHDAYAKPGSAGKAALHCEVRIADGEVQVRGPNVMRRYWNNPEATAAAFAEDGWFRTGDLGRWDEDGFLWIDGRSKDLIISGGENIHPAELENVLADCPDIAESAVIGIADPKWGETACAVVVRKPGAVLDEAGVLALFKDRLARYKHPRRVVFADSLPRNAMGKVQKFELKKLVGG
ncbi:MAG: long-chain fatty acid--CoA ligase [Proteobacteria bacterium]|nr:long-chain fatty acid--CoA ligase [Pseudomonadota bacterium]